MATLLSFTKLTKALAVLITVVVHIHCLHSPAANGGNLERDLSHVNKRLPTAGSNNHKHRHHKTDKTRSSKHRRQMRKEKQIFSKEEENVLASNAADKIKNSYIQPVFEEASTHKLSVEPPSSFDNKEEKHQKDSSLSQNSSFKKVKPYKKEKADSKTKQDIYEESVAQVAKESEENQTSETESLSYTDRDGELHDLTGFFDDNSTSLQISEDFNSLSNDTSHSPEQECRECRKRKEQRETIRENRKRALQQQILFALRMEKPPNATGRRYPKAPGFVHLYRNSENLMMADAPSGGNAYRDSSGHEFHGNNHFHMEEESEEEIVRTKMVYIRAQAGEFGFCTLLRKLCGSLECNTEIYLSFPNQ
ncbi:hypothetical protein RRG08_004476 [Elysia crispata]|uniref:Uncharacterized protein n=1 Tax=Elysia crispata TaxID=231223 RepID=A0AAE1EC84_9GAST|nr:hypothetical protein RRG08_004476 [Elysia crispata]